VLGIVENMSHFNCPHCNQEIDVFSTGGAERMAKQFSIAYFGAIELDADIRRGGDTGLPVALAGPEFLKAKQFYRTAQALAEAAIEHDAKLQDVLEIT
jgi:ATP-binding protein involved in chromosome partitioning